MASIIYPFDECATVKTRTNIFKASSTKSLQDYTIVIRPDDNGTFVAYVPAIPCCHTWGQTLLGVRGELVYVFEMIQEE